MYLTIIIVIIVIMILVSRKHEHFSLEEIENKVDENCKMSLKEKKELYNLLEKSTKFLRNNGIQYWICAGTLLGAVRSKGIIPWDDDLDVAINVNDVPKLEALEKDLNQHGLGLAKKYNVFYKIYDKTRSNIAGQHYSWPFLDIFPMKKLESDNWVLSNLRYQTLYPNEMFRNSELYPLREYQMGLVKVQGPNNPLPYLYRAYGDKCLVEAKTGGRNHRKEKVMCSKKTYPIT